MRGHFKSHVQIGKFNYSTSSFAPFLNVERHFNTIIILVVFEGLMFVALCRVAS